MDNTAIQERLLRAAMPLVRTAQDAGHISETGKIIISVAGGLPVEIRGESRWARGSERVGKQLELKKVRVEESGNG